MWQATADELKTKEYEEILRKRIFYNDYQVQSIKLLINLLILFNFYLQILVLIKIDVLVSYHVVQKQLHNINLI